MPSLMRPPSEWPDMTYTEVVKMLCLASVERGLVSSQNNSFNYPTESQRHTYGKWLTFLTGNLKRLLNVFNDGGSFLNPNIDVTTLPGGTGVTRDDLSWNMTDILADIGDPAFFDFSTGISTGPEFAKDIGYRDNEHLTQYYNILTRLKRPMIQYNGVPLNGKYGGWDTGIEYFGEEIKNSFVSSRKSRTLTTQLEGLSFGENASSRLGYGQWQTTGQTDHDNDYALLYPFPTNDGSTKAATLVGQMLTSGNMFHARFRALPSGNVGAKSGQNVNYERIKFIVDHQGYTVGNLNSVNGVTNELKWLAWTNDYPGGDLNNPFDNSGNLFWVDQPVIAGIAQDFLHADHPGRPAQVDIPTTSPNQEHGFEYRVWRIISFEHWDYDGGYEYYTEP